MQYTDHAVRDDTAWSLRVGGEEACRMAGVEHQRLVLLHHGEVVHDQPELGPVGQHLPIPSICHQLLRKLPTMKKITM